MEKVPNFKSTKFKSAKFKNRFIQFEFKKSQT